MKKKQPTLEFIKKLYEVDFIANLVVGMLKNTKQSYLFLKGEIGSGKTTLVKEIAKVLNEKRTIVSPTFNKMFVYENMVHIDAYNLEGQNLRNFEDYFDDKIVIIEWAELLSEKIDEGFEIEILYIDDNTRKYIIRWRG